MQSESRQVRRRQMFVEWLAAINDSHLKYRYPENAQRVGLARRERRNLARARAAGEWRGAREGK